MSVSMLSSVVGWMIMIVGQSVEWKLTVETEVLGEKTTNDTCPPQMSHAQTWARVRIAAMGSWWITCHIQTHCASGVFRPLKRLFRPKILTMYMLFWSDRTDVKFVPIITSKWSVVSSKVYLILLRQLASMSVIWPKAMLG